MNIYRSLHMSRAHGQPSSSMPPQLATGDARSLLLAEGQERPISAPPPENSNNADDGTALQSELGEIAGQLDTLADLYGNGHIHLFEACRRLDTILENVTEVTNQQRVILAEKYINRFEQGRTRREGAIE